MRSQLIPRLAHRHSGEQLLEVVTGNRLTLGDEEAGLPDHRLQDVVEQLVVQPDTRR